MNKKIKFFLKIFLVICASGFAVFGFVYNYVIKTNNNQDISNANLKYSTKVNHINNLNSSEASLINEGIYDYIVQAMNIKYSAFETIDYTINNLNLLVTGADLNTFNILVVSSENSQRIKSETVVSLNLQEDISTWSLPETIKIPQSQENGLQQYIADMVSLQIALNVNTLLNQNRIQKNDLNIDYTILNLNLISENASFSTYSNQIFVQSLPKSKKLTGKFQVNFEIINMFFI